MKFLIIGLGNIGPEYAETRHNIGFKIADEIAKREGVSFKMERLAFFTEYKFKSRTVYLIKPTTYMNLSGKALKFWADYYKIPIENTLTLVDDIALPFGKIRLKPSGSSAGHNGLKNIETILGSQKYPRLKFGIGDNFAKGRQVDYVLGQWTKEENEQLGSYIDAAIKTIDDFIFLGIERAMNIHN
jgi:peptidyl-tRNA hydrolase, PTH1 family